jgi:hypothetical protein
LLIPKGQSSKKATSQAFSCRPVLLSSQPVTILRGFEVKRTWRHRSYHTYSHGCPLRCPKRKLRIYFTRYW